MNGRQCSICGEVKPPESFCRNKYARDGRARRCLECNRARNRAYGAKRRAEQRGAYNASRRAWNHANPEKVNAIRERWRERNPQKQRELRRANNQAMQAYRAAHAEELKAYRKRFHEQRPGYNQKYRRAYKKRHPLAQRVLLANKRAQARGLPGRLTEADVVALYALQDNACAYCRLPLSPDHQIDHRIPMSRGGPNTPENICLACAKCNRKKWTKTADEFLAQLQLGV